MAYRVDLTERATRNLRRIYRTINAEDSAPARDWFNGLEKAVFSLDEHPARAPVIPEDDSLRHLLYGRKPNVYRIIYALDERNRVVTVLRTKCGAPHLMRNVAPVVMWRRARQALRRNEAQLLNAT